MPFFKIHVETTTRGHVYIEAPDEATATLAVENATLEEAFRGQALRDAIEEKVEFNVLSMTQQIPGVDFR